jgi:multiple sugar transport system permease protein
MRQRGRRLVPLALLLPATALITAVLVLPTAQAIVLAFTDASGAADLGGIRAMLGDLAFTDAARNVLVLLLVIFPLQIALATAIALRLSSTVRGAGPFLYLAAVPLAVSDLAAGLLWLALFTDRGYLNSALQGAGAITQPITWLASDNIGGIIVAVVFAETWRTISIFVITFLAAVPQSPLVATSSPRTSDLVRPMLRASLPRAIAIRALLVLQTFALVFALAGRNLPVLAGQAYERFAANRDEHASAAYVVVILALGVIASVLYLRSAVHRNAVIAA